MSDSHVQSAKAIAEDIAHRCCVPDDWRLRISDLRRMEPGFRPNYHRVTLHSGLLYWMGRWDLLPLHAYRDTPGDSADTRRRPDW